MNRPENHVTKLLNERAARMQSGGDISKAPDIDEALVDYLEDLFPPRVYDHRSESLEDHIEYAGKVGLVGFLRAALDLQQRRDGGDIDDPYPDNEG